MNKIQKLYAVTPPFLLSAIVLATVLALTLMPIPQEVVPEVDNADKVVHFLMFGAITCMLWLDMAHYKHTHLKWSQYLIMAIVSSALGGIIELLQGTELIHRSCDFYDFVADSAGAFILPPLFRPLINLLIPADNIISLRTTTLPDQRLKPVYTESFPPEERRDWQDIMHHAHNGSHPLQFTEVLWHGKPVGMISWWNFGEWMYLEHFAVNGNTRGKGIGSVALHKWLDMTNLPAVLEVEPADANDMAPRRIKFYERLGFKAHHEWNYVQPPYKPNLPSVALILMTYGNTPNLNVVENVLHTQVYGVKK